MRWTSPDGKHGKIHPLVDKNFTANLLGQDNLGKMDAVVTMDHKVFYQDISNEKEAQRQEYNLKWVKEKSFFFNNYLDEHKKPTQVYLQS